MANPRSSNWSFMGITKESAGGAPVLDSLSLRNGFYGRNLGLTFIERQVPVRRVQNRIHPRKKRRLQKKWLKLYGSHFEAAISQTEIETIYRIGRDVYFYAPMRNHIEQLVRAISNDSIGGLWQPM